MVNMQMSDKERGEYPDTAMAPRPLYPYGLCVYLDDDTLEKLGLDKLPQIDQVMEFRIKAQVTSVRSGKVNNDDEDSSVGLQITDMELADDGEGKDYAKSLYGG